MAKLTELKITTSLDPNPPDKDTPWFWSVDGDDGTVIFGWSASPKQALLDALNDLEGTKVI